MEEYINTVLRPLLQGDGGELEVDRVEGDTVFVTLRGECSKCDVADRCLEWCKQKILTDRGERVTFVATRKKPYFWEK
ncbi:MAG: NifU family protein [Clostridia bacterium]|nr:NifU family protein [Clostridia bacterium]